MDRKKTNYFQAVGIILNKRFGFNVLPLMGKRPIIEWDNWQTVNQCKTDIDSMNWENTTGIGVIMKSGLVNLDLDKVTNKKLPYLLLAELGLKESYEWLIESGSGRGYHIYFRMNNFELIEQKMGSKAVHKFKPKNSKDCKGIELRVRECQNAFPPSLHESGGKYSFVNNEPFELPPFIDSDRLIACLEKHCVIKSRESNITKQKQVNYKKENIQYDKDKLESALDFLSKKLPEGSYEDWYRIGFALVGLGGEGEKYFVEFSKKNENYNDSESELRKKYRKLVKDYDGRISLGTIFHIAEDYGWKKPFVKFWNLDEKGKVKIVRVRFKMFLEAEGFCKYKMEPNYIFVRIIDNVVYEIGLVDMKEFIMRYLNSAPADIFENTNRLEIIDTIMKNANQLFTNQNMEFLVEKEIKFNVDTAARGYIYFKNVFVEITKDKKIVSEYKNMREHVWEKQIIERNYYEISNRSSFEDFLYNICQNEKERFNALKSAIGYLLHRYKNPSNTKAVIFIDEKMSENAYGRSGKGLAIKSIAEIRNVVIEDGRNFKPSKSFAFQRVKVNSNIIAFEDLGKNFPFEKLFSIITDGITVEEKNKEEIFCNASREKILLIKKDCGNNCFIDYAARFLSFQ